MSRWRVIPSGEQLVEREKDYTAQFDCHNVDSGSCIKIEFTQVKGGPVSDLIASLRALAKVLLDAANGDEHSTEKMH